ncbi:MAG: hypothetical protein ACP5I8_04940 [Phycisphaerae bacterium]
MLFQYLIKVSPILGLIVIAGLVGGCSQQSAMTSRPSQAIRTQTRNVCQVAGPYAQNVHWGDEFTPN